MAVNKGSYHSMSCLISDRVTIPSAALMMAFQSSVRVQLVLISHDIEHLLVVAQLLLWKSFLIPYAEF